MHHQENYPAINYHPLTTTADTLVIEAIALMSQNQSSCIMVLAEKERNSPPIGLFTERDVVLLTASGTNLSNLSLAAVMTKQLTTITHTQAEDIFNVVKLLRQHQIRHLPVVDEEQNLVGIITPQSIQQFLKPVDLLRLKQVSEMMSTSVVHTTTKASILELAQLMTRERVSCVVIVENSITEELALENPSDSDPPKSPLTRGTLSESSPLVEESLSESSPLVKENLTKSSPLNKGGWGGPQALFPIGIVTERDIIQFYNLGLELGKTSAATIMSTPVLSIKPNDSMWIAHQTMQKQRVRRLIVTQEEEKLVGIITQTSVLNAMNPLEAYQTVQTWQHLVNEQTAELRQLNQKLKQEIEERQILETHLRTSEKKMRALFEAMTELILVVSVRGNQLGNIEIAPMNPNFAAQLGNALISQTVESFFQAPTAKLWLNQVQQALTTKQTLNFDYSLTISEEQLWFSARISPISETSVIWVARDITARQRAEEALRQKNEELASTLQQLQTTQQELIQAEKMASLGQLIAGVAHEINTPMGAIQASITNISFALDNSLQQLPQIFQELPPERQTDFFTLLAANQKNQEPLSFREERKCKRAIRKQLEALGIDNADIMATNLIQLGITQDITPFIPLLQDPKCHLVLDAAYNLVTQQNNSHNIQLAVERASKIVFALKSYVRQGNSGEMTKVQVTEGIDVVLTIYQNYLKQGIEVVKDYQNVPEIFCYPEELNQVWTNLVHNAIQAMNYQGRLVIKVYQQDNQVVVQFTDSGGGISPEIKAKIFEPFFTTKPAGEGSGLGLNIVRKIIDKHQGKILVDSVPGKTVFSIYLPFREVGN